MAEQETFLDASLLSPVNWLARESPRLRDWIFTFGAGHRGHAMLRGDRQTPSSAMGQGFRLDNRYVVINGTFRSARARMVDLFGQVWCAQYGARELAGIDEYGLVELPLTGDETKGIDP